MDDRVSWRPWIIVGILTLLWHLLLFTVPWNELLPTHTHRLPTQINIQPVSQEQLESIRKQWRNRKNIDKQILIKKDTRPNEKEAPADARYMSDKNRKVEHEQQAIRTNVVPKLRDSVQPKPQGQSKTDELQRTRKIPTLSHLGVPLRFGLPQLPFQERQPAEDRGDQALLEKALPFGSENMLNTQESVYYSYYSRLYQAIGPVWQSRIREVPYSRRVAPGNYVTQVEVLFDRSGNMTEIRYHHSSGMPEFDQAVESAWRKIGQFPNPPNALIEQDGTVHTAWSFTVEVGEDFNRQYLPPTRNY